MVTNLSYAYLFQLVISGLMARLPFTPVCTCISLSDIYTIEDVGILPIFNLLCNHPTSVTCKIPRTLLIPSSSLAKATRFAIKGSPSVSCLLVVKSSLRVYFGALVTED